MTNCLGQDARKKIDEARLEWNEIAKKAEAAAASAQMGNTFMELDDKAYQLWLEVAEVSAKYDNLCRELASIAYPSTHTPIAQPGNPIPIVFKDEKYQGAAKSKR